MQHLITTKDIDRQDVERLIEQAEWMRQSPRTLLRDRLLGGVVATLFYEPSTRTRLSFAAAAARLGANVIGAENAQESSSAKKGESLPDVFRVVGSYSDVIVIRHHEANELAESVSVSPVPVVSAGAGAGEHPTQALLDVYTLWREFGKVDNLHICFAGDLRYGRTVHSLLQVLTKFHGVEATLVSTPGLGLPEPLATQLRSAGLVLHEVSDFNAALADTDALYQTRLQRERFLPETVLSESEVQRLYELRPEHLHMMKHSARILHPLPRVGEIDPAVDGDERAAYFRQVENGLYIRMALLDHLLRGVLQ